MNSNLNKIKLSRKQSISLGLTKQQLIKSSHNFYQFTTKFFKQFKSTTKQPKCLQNQTYQQFKQMSLKGPNQDGTGRYPFKKIEKIYFAYIPKKNMRNSQKILIKKEKKLMKKQQKSKKNNQKTELSFKYQDSIIIIQKILSVFFQTPVQYYNFDLCIDSKSNKIIDEKQMISFDIQTNNQKCFQVFSLFDLASEYKQKKIGKNKSLKNQKRNLILFLIEANLIQGQDQIQIDRRVNGDELAFVTFNSDDFKLNTFQELKKYQFISYTLPTLIHQCLHNLGFDHCSAWECLMNSVTNQQFWLCPCCLRKLQSQISHIISIKQWHKNVVQAIKQVKKQFKTKYGTKKSIRFFQFLYEIQDQTDNQKPSNKKRNKFITMLEKGQKIIKSIQNLQKQ